MMPLYCAAEHPMICLGCAAPREIDHETTTPGVIRYTACPACGPGVGITRPDDNYRGGHTKKSKRDLYERSRYRGGRLKT